MTSLGKLVVPLLVLSALAITSVNTALVAYPEDVSQDYHLLLVVGINSTSIEPGEMGNPLIPLTKVGCGSAVAIVYGYRSGEPLIVAIYGANESSLMDASGCVNALRPCLSSAGVGWVADEILEKIRAAGKPVEANTTTSHATLSIKESGISKNACLATISVLVLLLTASIVALLRRRTS
ncbi:hypothetical protein PYJP_05850 [Pyrofollis japonicus]|uniref:hypothetical protein n=1 Tax=Pyrofollis japonicus TaxID=3060460 RepID=UPI00295B6FCD|nr:hypothetical protein [Pyrofollis japonicus]BEP17233.1 hypothetical protein PYJP_05850 [Pyrofollis japonicus]